MTAAEDATIIDAEGVEVGPDQVGEQATSTTTAALVPVAAYGGITRPVAEVDVVRAAFTEYERLRATIVVASDITVIQGKQFVNKSGWRKLAVVMGVSGTIVSRDYQRDGQARIMSAEVIVRATAPNGRSMDGLGACDLHERCCPKAFNIDAVCKDKRNSHHHCDPGCDGFNHFSKPQHDIPATASTRALNRACSDLFGFGEVSAEEVTDREEPADEADCLAIAAAMNAIEEEAQRKGTKHAFVQKFGLPNELKKGQLEAARRFVTAGGGKFADPAATAAPPPASPDTDPTTEAPDEPHATDQGGKAPVRDADSGSSGKAAGTEAGSIGKPPPTSVPARPSTTQQRRTIGIAFSKLEKEQIVDGSAKAEIVGYLTNGRTSTTTEITFDEAVKLVALAHFLEQGTVVYEPTAGLSAKGQPGVSFLNQLDTFRGVI